MLFAKLVAQEEVSTLVWVEAVSVRIALSAAALGAVETSHNTES
jgi:hypothetical protein